MASARASLASAEAKLAESKATLKEAQVKDKRLKEFVYVKDQFNLKQIAKLVPRYFVASMMMLLLLKAEDMVLQPGIFNTMLMVVSGAVTYFVVLFILRDKFVFEAFATLKKKIRKG